MKNTQSIALIALLFCTVHVGHCMQRFSPANVSTSIRSVPRSIYSYYSHYFGTPGTPRKQFKMPAQTKQTGIPNMQKSSIHTSSAPQFHATPSIFSSFTRWGRGKPSVDDMFGSMNQFLAEPSADPRKFNELMQHIENGDYDAIINETKQLKLVQPYILGKEIETEDATILDVILSRLMKFDTFGQEIGMYFENHNNLPLPKYTDFFDERTTPQYIAIINALLRHGANIANSHNPTFLIAKIAETYGFIKKVVSPPQNPELKQKFSEYLNFMESVARSLAAINKKTFQERNLYKSFAEMFNKKADLSYIPSRGQKKEYPDWIDIIRTFLQKF